MSLRIDAHQHFWSLARGDYRWLGPELRPLYRDFGPCDLAPYLAAHGIDATVLVQAADTVAETEFLLEIASARRFVAGVVGWVDFEAADAPDVLARLAQSEKLVGVRPMIQDLADERWMLRAQFAPVFRALIQLDLAFDALVKPQHLKHLAQLLEQHPELRVVIDHGAKPDVAAGRDWRGFAAWRSNLRALAAHPGVHCKLSGLVTEAAPGWTLDDLRPFSDELFAAFSAQRLMWGSDWPVVELAGGYDRWMHAARALGANLHPAEQLALFGASAAAFYGLTWTDPK